MISVLKALCTLINALKKAGKNTSKFKWKILNTTISLRNMLLYFISSSINMESSHCSLPLLSWMFFFTNATDMCLDQTGPTLLLFASARSLKAFLFPFLYFLITKIILFEDFFTRFFRIQFIFSIHDLFYLKWNWFF